MKKLFSLIVCSVLLFGTFSCKNEEDDIFGQSSAERLEEAKQKYKDLFASSLNGWVMEYFPTNSSKGYVFVVKFDKNTSVLMAAQNEYTDNKYQEAISVWDIISDNGPVLTFDTSNDVFHLFAEPGSDGTGLGGDYEFIILEPKDNNTIILKGKKRGTYIRFTRLIFDEGVNENTARQEYFAEVANMNKFLFSNVPNGYDLIVGSERYTCTNGSTNIFSALLEGKDAISDTEYLPFVVTAKGLKLYEAMSNGAQEFVLNAAKTGFDCVETQESHIECELPVNFFIRIISDGQREWSLDLKQFSGELKTAYAKLEASLDKENYKVSKMVWTRDAIRNSFVLKSTFKRGNGSVYVSSDYNFLNKGNNIISYEFKNEFDENGKYFADTNADYLNFLKLLSTQFEARAANQNVLNLSKIKLVSVDDPNSGFILGL